MKKILSIAACLAILGVTGTTFAATITFTDTTTFTSTGTNAPEDLVSYGGGTVNKIGDNIINLGFLNIPLPDYVTWKHQFTFSPEASSIASAKLILTFRDDNDRLLPEYAVGWLDSFTGSISNWTWDFGEIETGSVPYDINVGYVADGSLQVTVGNLGLTDFYLDKSELTVTYQPVPEPATMLLFGTGLAGLVAMGRRRTT
jgi:hypothetical protein